MSDRVLTFYKGEVSMEIDSQDPFLEEKIGCGIMGVSFADQGKEGRC
jgi:hypothetical protein